MTKTPRLLLVILLVALSIGGAALGQSGIREDIKVLLIGVDILLWLGAVTTLAFNVFSLDAQGRIPYNSLAWKYFSLYFRRADTEGNSIVSMPGRIKVCPMYWFIVLGIFLSVGALVVGSTLVYVFYVIVDRYADGAINTFGFTTDMFIWVLLTMFFLSIYKSIVPMKTNKFWPICLGATSLVMVILVAGFLISSALASEVTILGFLLKVGFIVGSVLAGLIVLVVLLTFLSFAVVFVFGWFKETLFGQLAGSLYGKLCPVISVEPAPKK